MQQVTVLGAISRELPVTSGVPQGSLLGTIQFLLFVDDLSNAVKTSGVACYADDTCDTEKDLEVWVSSNLTSDKQVSEQCAKAKNSSGLCADFLGTSKAPKRVVHCTFLSSGAISAMQPKYGRHSPLAY